MVSAITSLWLFGTRTLDTFRPLRSMSQHFSRNCISPSCQGLVLFFCLWLRFQVTVSFPFPFRPYASLFQLLVVYVFSVFKDLHLMHGMKKSSLPATATNAAFFLCRNASISHFSVSVCNVYEISTYEHIRIRYICMIRKSWNFSEQKNERTWKAD